MASCAYSENQRLFRLKCRNADFSRNTRRNEQFSTFVHAVANIWLSRVFLLITNTSSGRAGS
jgi:hypothetical protein